MATLKYRLNRKNSSGSYDTIHYETSSNIVLRPSGRTVEQDLEAYLPRTQATDDVPQSLNKGSIVASPNHIWAGLNSVTELAKQTDLNSLKSSVSSGKAQIASAITDKGVSTSSTASFSVMANNIRKLEIITDGIDKLITGWSYRSSFRGYRNETPEVTGTCVYTASNSSNSYNLTPYQYNTTTALCSFRRSSSTYFRLEVPSSTFDGKRIVLSGANGIRTAISLSSEDRTFRYYIEDYDTSAHTITIRVPSFSFTEDGVTKRVTCTNLIVVAPISSEIYAMPPNDNVYFDIADIPLSYS